MLGGDAAIFADQLDPAKNHKAIVGIDFGTSECGYSYAFTKPGERLDPRVDVFSNSPWPGTHGGKTATAILMKQDDSGKWEVLSIGEQAVLAVSNMRPTDRKQHFFVRHFKMRLYEPATNARLMIEDSYSSIKLKAVDVIGGLLGHIKGASLKQVRLATRATINEDDVLWVVTVPAIWRESAKKLMREAAETGGLIRPGKSASLLLALEPEAASMCWPPKRATPLSLRTAGAAQST
ncbi:hypothetical protein DFJ73DRAFT_961055 [Zopfochytrium polystomum]|nr:hypothetical protein DFJ73DRAFT_961055 [Zopfochytrium polystomum]